MEKTLEAIITFVIGLIAVLIQRQQAETNRRQYRLALFKQRVAVFNAVVEFIKNVTADGNVELPSLFKLSAESANYPFLFGKDVQEYMDELQKKGLAVRSLNLKLKAGTAKDNDVTNETELLIWFSNQFKGAESVFLKYINFREP